MSTNEPPVDPTANPGAWRPPTEPSVEPVGAEALADAAGQTSSGDEPITAPPAWQPPTSFDPTASPAYPPVVDPPASGERPTGATGVGDAPPPPGGSFLPGTDSGYTTGASSLGDAGTGYVPGASSPAVSAVGSGDGPPAGYPAGGAGTGNDGSGWAPGAAAAAGAAAGAAASATGAATGQAFPGGPPPVYPPPPPSYPAPPQPAAVQPPRKRPGVVAAAAGILLILAICGLGQSVLTLASMGSTVDRFKERARIIGASRSDIDSAVSQMRASYIGGMFVTILIAVVLAGLAYGLLRGSNGARIATWVVSGLAVLCDCCSSVFYLGIGGINLTTNGTNDVQAQLAQAQLDAFPSWFLATGGGLSLLQLLGYIATAVLLALPAANAFFKKVAPGWLPPTP
ncbi:hypothetical protein F4553_004275 [Allocatelliglobosispora scoriae]|uniref:Uncharacterized protein n=1 Tax=Allocatelliglobosispora scoriae TaxID=643052 RepID=A0A841BTY9_9ACTN|nr:hypothetical protein [Allocatelliglobosispora scoriae]MBB5870896.1 hypothetical protein [Allocatelliglobosispora scoriae]